MNELRTILVGVDFSDCSRCALEQAVRLARWNNAALKVIHVMDSAALDNSMASLPPELDEWRRLHREHALRRLADWTNEAGAPDGHSREVMNGAPLELLLQESRTRRVELLVLGITGDSLLPYGAGTLATKCLRKSSPAKLSALADFEKNCRVILENNLRQFAAVPPETPALCSVTQAKTHGHGIADYCRSVDADLVVIGTRGRTTLKYMLLGSTVERLLKEIPCSVLVVRPQEVADEKRPTANTG